MGRPAPTGPDSDPTGPVVDHPSTPPSRTSRRHTHHLARDDTFLAPALLIYSLTGSGLGVNDAVAVEDLLVLVLVLVPSAGISGMSLRRPDLRGVVVEHRTGQHNGFWAHRRSSILRTCGACRSAVPADRIE